VKELLGTRYEVKDLGTFNEEPVDYPLFIRPAAEAVARGECERGIVFGGSGNGEAMVANKVHGVRCALCWNEESARLSRKHNDADVLSIGERLIPEDLALKIVQVWLETGFDGGRHERRVEMLNAMFESLGAPVATGSPQIGKPIDRRTLQSEKRRSQTRCFGKTHD
jgi:ribose 5-phosphate isomerase B